MIYLGERGHPPWGRSAISSMSRRAGQSRAKRGTARRGGRDGKEETRETRYNKTGGSMKIIIKREPEKVIVRVRAKGAARGDLSHIIYPGRTWQGWSYEELWDLGSGDHTIKIPRPE